MSSGEAGVWFGGGFVKKRRIWPWIVGAILLVALAVVWVMPQTRNAIANTLGLRAEFRIIATEEGAGNDIDGQPLVQLRHFTARLDDRKLASDADTAIVVSDAPFGHHVITVEKTGYQSSTAERTLNADLFFGLFGRPVIDDVIAPLQSDAPHTTLKIEDWVSGQPLRTGQFITGDRIAKPNQDGEVNLLLSDEFALSVTVEFERNYLDKTITINPADEVSVMRAVPDGFVYTIDTQNYDIYRGYVDGSAKKKFIAATEQETPGLQFAVSPGGNFAVMASTREGARDAGGDVVEKLYLVNLADASMAAIDEGYDFNLYDWSKNQLVYSYRYKMADSDSKRQRLRSVDVGTKHQYELGNIDGTLARVHIADNTVVYVAKQPNGQNLLATVGLQGAAERRLGSGIDDLRQTHYETFTYRVGEKAWNTFNVSTNQITTTSAPTANQQLFFATPTPQNERLVVTFKDDKKSLGIVSVSSDVRQLVASAKLSGQVRFINATSLVYRQGGTVFAVSTLGGTPKEIAKTHDTAYESQPFFAFY